MPKGRRSRIAKNPKSNKEKGKKGRHKQKSTRAKSRKN
jgi:hypothetical protein